MQVHVRPPTAETMTEFWEVAELLGHDREQLLAGAEVCTYFLIPEAEQARRILSRADAQRRALRGRTFYDAIQSRQRLGQGMHDRGEAFVFADAQVCEADRHGLNRHFPVHVKAVSVVTKVVPAGQMWDVSVRGDVWGLDDMEELYCVVNVGTLILEPGASVVVRGNVFSLTCQRLMRASGRSGESAGLGYDLGVLPTPFPQDIRTGPVDGLPGRPGDHGADGAHAVAPVLSSTLFGPLLLEPIRPRALTGGPGLDGGSGEPGGRGRNGGPCKLAELNIRDIDAAAGPVVVFAEAGRGGNGGAGDRGGDGGRGGDGAAGCRSLDGPVPAGNGGDGGAAGDGGHGGPAGNGGIASNIYVVVPQEQEDRIVRIARASEPGEPGPGGPAGTPGIGGQAGAAGATGTPGVGGRTGAAGRASAPGHPGRSRPAPAIFLNEKG